MPNAGRSKGVLAAGMENGELGLWDPEKIISGSECVSSSLSCIISDSTDSATDALILRNTTHQGTVRGLDFNPIQTNLLSSGAVNGEVRTFAAYDHINLEEADESSRFIFGTLRIPASLTLPARDHPNWTRSHPWLGIDRFSMFLRQRALQATLLSGIFETSVKLLLWLTVEQLKECLWAVGKGLAMSRGILRTCVFIHCFSNLTVF